MNNKKKSIVWMVILGFIVLFFAGLYVWQKDNINVIIKTFSTTSSKIAEEIDESKKQLEQELQNQYPSVISDFSAEEEKQIIKGELSVEDAIKGLKERFETEKPAVRPEMQTNPNVDALIGEKAIELYSLKAYYLGQLGQMEAAVKKDYSKLPKEKRNIIGKQELVNKYMGKAMGLLNECDARVEELLNSLKSDLSKLGADTLIIKKIRDAYENEKNLKKAYYIKLLEE